jgi:adenine-specific DNA-methyltransferase
MTTQEKLGQYFTTSIILKETVYNFIENSPETILEPCIGQGDLVSFIKEQNPSISFDMYEIDDKIPLLDGINKEDINYTDFLKEKITKKYTTIVCNPPYIKTKKGNLYLDFIKKCYELLEYDGEMIFIVPSDIFKLTSASKLLNDMMIHGTFTHIFHANDENMFENASIDVIIFRYCKNDVIPKRVLYNDTLLYVINSVGMVTFMEEENENNIMFKDYFDIFVGFVSGKESVYKNEELGTMPVLNGENKVDKYICISQFPCSVPTINEHLLKHKEGLISRQIRNFNESNWFEWGAMRNVSSILQHYGKDCIYIYNLTRSSKVAFIDKAQYFGGSLIMLVPKRECDLSRIVSYLNSDTFKNNFMFSGRFKIGHRGISNSFIPSAILL